jgi:hypothetical protein
MTLFLESSITDMLFEKVLVTYIFPLLESRVIPLGPLPTGIVAITLFIEVSITDIVSLKLSDPVLATYT